MLYSSSTIGRGETMMTQNMSEYIALVVRLEVAAKAVLHQGLTCDTRLALEEALEALDTWLKENLT
jgi:hypothetical protein